MTDSALWQTVNSKDWRRESASNRADGSAKRARYLASFQSKIEEPYHLVLVKKRGRYYRSSCRD